MRKRYFPELFLIQLIALSVLIIQPIVVSAAPDHEADKKKFRQKQQDNVSSNKRKHSGYDTKHYQTRKRSEKQPYSNQRHYQPRKRSEKKTYSNQRHYQTTPTRRDWSQRDANRRYGYRYDYRYTDRPSPVIQHKYRKPGKRTVRPSRRYQHNYTYVMPFRGGYPRYKPLYHKNNFWGWLAFTVVTLQILDHLDDEQQRAHERALYRATTSPIDTVIVWREGGVSGSVTPVWEGPGNTGQYCREYRHEITIGNRVEITYGSACRRPDGTWEVVR